MLKSFFPEIFLSFSILLQLLVNTRVINNTKLNFPIVIKEAWTQTLFILGCVLVLFNKVSIENFLLEQSIINDQSTIIVKSLLILISIALTIVIRNALYLQKINHSEYYTIYLISILSLLIMISAVGVISFYLADRHCLMCQGCHEVELI